MVARFADLLHRRRFAFPILRVLAPVTPVLVVSGVTGRHNLLRTLNPIRVAGVAWEEPPSPKGSPRDPLE